METTTTPRRADTPSAPIPDPSRPHTWTLIAAGLIVLVTLPFLWRAYELVQILITGELDQARQLEMIAFNIDPTSNRFLFQFGAVMMLGTSAWSLLLAAGVAMRWDWSRMGALMTFLLFGFIATMLGLGALTAEPRPSNWFVAILIGPLNLTIAGLLASRTVADDIERGAFYRAQRRRPAA